MEILVDGRGEVDRDRRSVDGAVGLDQRSVRPRHPVFLEQLAAASIRITLAEGEKKTQDLKLAGG